QEPRMVSGLLQNGFPLRPLLREVLRIERLLRSHTGCPTLGVLQRQSRVFLQPLRRDAETEKSPQKLDALGAMLRAASPGDRVLGEQRNVQLIEGGHTSVAAEVQKAMRHVALGLERPLPVNADECH